MNWDNVAIHDSWNRNNESRLQRLSLAVMLALDLAGWEIQRIGDTKESDYFPKRYARYRVPR